MRSIRYLRSLFRFSFAQNPILYFCVVLSGFSVAIELLAMSSLLPLSMLMVGQPVSKQDHTVQWLRKVGLQPQVHVLLLTFTVLFTVRIITQLVFRGLVALSGKKVLAQLCSEALTNVIERSSLPEIERKGVGHYLSLIGDESNRASVIIVQGLELIGVVLLAALYYLALCWYSPHAAIAIIVFLLITLLVMLPLLRRTKQLGASLVQESREVNGSLIDTLSGFRSVKAFMAEAFVTGNHRRLIHNYSSLLARIDCFNVFIRLGPVLLLLAAFGAYVAFHGAGLQNEARIARLLTLLMLVMRLFPVIGQCVTAGMRVLADLQTARDVTELIHRPETQSSGLRHILEARVNHIVAERVSFAYDPARPVLSGVSFTLRAGRTYAITGSSGTGKSTLVNLILNFHSPCAGRLLINGVPIAEVDSSSLRERVILLEQQTVIFSDTVRNNISFGKQFSDEQIRRAARLACVDDIIQALPEGYDTRLHFHGANLSGGQRQRIGLARAFLRQADVLILDEGTSGLDSETRDKVLSNMLQEYSERIVIVITHDEEVARQMDEVIVLRSGGTSLTAKCG